MARLKTVPRGLRGGSEAVWGGVLGLLGGLLGAERHPFNDVQGVLGPFLAALGLYSKGMYACKYMVVVLVIKMKGTEVTP